MIYFCDLEAAENGSGVSWDDPKNTLGSLSFLSGGHQLWIKEHEGYPLGDGIFVISDDAKVLGGFDKRLTGKNGDPLTRSSMTKIVAEEGPPSRGISITGNSVTISRFWVDGYSYNGEGSGIFSGGLSAIIDHCAVTRCASATSHEPDSPFDGGGIFVKYQAVISDTVVVGCSAGINGGGVCAGEGAQVTAIRCSLIRNTAGAYDEGYGGGVYGANVAINRCWILSNKALLGGGCFFPSGATAAVWNTVVSKNSAEERGGGIYAQGESGVIGCNITDNRSGAFPGGVMIVTGGSVIFNSVIANNLCPGSTWQVYGAGADAGCIGYSVFGSTNAVSPAGLAGPNVSIETIVFRPPPDGYCVNPADPSVIPSGAHAGIASLYPVDIAGADRKDSPSIGAFEFDVPPWTPPEPGETTADEILANMDRDVDVNFWTRERLNALQTLGTFSTWHGRISTKLDLVPVSIRYTYNEIDDGFFADLSADDGSIDAKGLRFSSGVDILDGLAISELGKLFVIDTLKKGEDPTYEGLGDRFKLIYLPRAYE